MPETKKQNTKAADERSEGAEKTSRPSAHEIARRVFAIEEAGLAETAARLGAGIDTAVELITSCRGRVVVSGMGKSGQICRKIAATLSSTGTAAVFLHAGEASHGDLGMFARGDVCVAVSNSGSTEELLALLPAIKRLDIPLIAITAGIESPLAKAADAVLDISVSEEACPMGLAPTASTTAALAMGDALAVAALEANGFSEHDFALLHPGGALGRRLLRVSDLMGGSERIPLAGLDLAVTDVLRIMTDGGLGVAAVVDEAGALVGVITDGDLRRAMLRHGEISSFSARDLMTREPKTVDCDALAARAMAVMEKYEITSLFIVDAQSGAPLGIIHLHDLLKAGIS